MSIQYDVRRVKSFIENLPKLSDRGNNSEWAIANENCMVSDGLRKTITRHATDANKVKVAKPKMIFTSTLVRYVHVKIEKIIEKFEINLNIFWLIMGLEDRLVFWDNE